VADHGVRKGAWRVAILLRREHPAEERLHSQHGEEVGRYDLAQRALRVIRRTDREERGVGRYNARSLSHLPLEVAKIGVRKRTEPGSFWPDTLQRRQFVRVPYAGNRPQQDRIHPAKDRCVRRDAQPKRHYGNRREPRIAPQRAESEAQIPPHV